MQVLCRLLTFTEWHTKCKWMFEMILDILLWCTWWQSRGIRGGFVICFPLHWHYPCFTGSDSPGHSWHVFTCGILHGNFQGVFLFCSCFPVSSQSAGSFGVQYYKSLIFLGPGLLFLQGKLIVWPLTLYSMDWTVENHRRVLKKAMELLLFFLNVGFTSLQLFIVLFFRYALNPEPWLGCWTICLRCLQPTWVSWFSCKLMRDFLYAGKYFKGKFLHFAWVLILQFMDKMTSLLPPKYTSLV